MQAAKDQSNTNSVDVDLLFKLAILAFLLLLFIMSYNLSAMAARVPRMITGVGAVITIIDLVLHFVKPQQVVTSKANSKGTTLPWFYSLLIVVLYVLSFNYFGFIIATFLVMIAYPFFLGYKRWNIILINSVVTTGVLYIVFVKFFYVRLPIGNLVQAFLGG